MAARVRCKLFNYNGRANVANKTNMTQVMDFDMVRPTNYTAGADTFSPMGGEITVDRRGWTSAGSRCNWAEVWFYDDQYSVDPTSKFAYWVEETAVVNGRAVLRLTPDALTTCYRNGALDTYALCARSQLGNQEKLDPMVARETFAHTTTWTGWSGLPGQGRLPETYVIAIPRVITASASDTSFSQSPGIDVYYLSKAAFIKFEAVWKLLDETTRQKRAACIVAAYCIPFSINTVIATYAMRALQTDRLIFPSMGGPSILQDAMIISDVSIFRVADIASASALTADIPWNWTFGSPLPMSTAGDHQDDVITVRVPEIGNISFTGHQAGVSTITSLAIRYALSPVTGDVLARLEINGNIREDLAIAGTYSDTIPILDDAFISKWVNWKGDMIAAVGNATVTAGASLAATAIAGAATGSPAGVGGMIAGAAVGALASLAGSAVSATSAHVNRATTDAMTPPNIQNGWGGSVDRAQQRVPAITVTHCAYYGTSSELTQLHALFGYPDGIVRRLSSLGGYVQTSGVALKASSLPRSIISEAEQMLNAGCYMSDPL